MAHQIITEFAVGEAPYLDESIPPAGYDEWDGLRG